MTTTLGNQMPNLQQQILVIDNIRLNVKKLYFYVSFEAFSGLHLPFVGFTFTQESRLSDLGRRFSGTVSKLCLEDSQLGIDFVRNVQLLNFQEEH